ncbi:MAG: PspC domain-containing protein [Prevotella sp.]|nr:PspC domain-containing protein [Bacteroides sp.]MCM1366750.1 PspC domain-containing protein [Prevotella sp.]MCM1437012.1 PspC domain-containing protein [Prevotella sp.]
MKITKNINLGGFLFTIDEDAFDLLNNYLDTLKNALKIAKEDSELLDDIEGRIAELLLEYTDNGKRIVTFRMVEKAIDCLGKPEEFIDIDISKDSSGNEDIRIEEEVTPPPFSQNIDEKKVKHRLYRDPRTKIIGGVCSGIASYFDIDVIWVRLIFVLSVLLSVANAFWIYLILWAIIPEAKTSLQFMELKGESPTLSNIGKTVKDAFSSYSDSSENCTETGFRSFLTSFMNVLGVIAKVCIVVMAIIAIPIVFALALALFAIIIAMIAYCVAGGVIAPYTIPFIYECQIPVWAVFGGSIATIFAIGIPLCIFLLILLNAYYRKKVLGKTWAIVLTVIWLIASLCTWIFWYYINFISL